MGKDWSDDPQARAWIRDVERNMTPKMEASAMVVSLVPTGPTDVKFAVELGMAIMLDKPIVMLVQPGTKVPARLVRVADEIIEGSISDPDTAKRVAAAAARYGGGDD